MPANVIEGAVARCRRESDLIVSLGGAGEAPYARLLADGHDAIWAAAGDHVELHASEWTAALASP
ncbi:MAG TPA: hypothetical protein VEU29_00925 [Actinomycetota bacterium]|nr:hypothetical protein [Actinomycetota bacterium]